MSDTFPIHSGQKEVIFGLALNIPLRRFKKTRRHWSQTEQISIWSLYMIQIYWMKTWTS